MSVTRFLLEWAAWMAGELVPIGVGIWMWRRFLRRPRRVDTSADFAAWEAEVGEWFGPVAGTQVMRPPLSDGDPR